MFAGVMKSFQIFLRLDRFKNCGNLFTDMKLNYSNYIGGKQLPINNDRAPPV